MSEEKEEIKICSCHDQEVPLLWTFAFLGAEYWCPACGYTGGMFGSGEEVEATEELKKSKEDWKKKTEEFLDAQSTLVCSGKVINGKMVDREDISKEEMDRCRKIVNEWKYEIE